MTAPPTVSIILPTFNRLHYLRPAVASVLAQTRGDWELLIVDDGSGVETIEYLHTIVDSRVQLIRLAHTGNPAAVRNAGLRRARGEYIAFLDSDDVWLPRKLQVQLAAMRRAARRWSYTAVTRIGPDGAVLPGEAGRCWTAHEGAIFVQLLGLRAAVATPTVVAERALIGQAGGFDEEQRYFEEYDLWLRMSLLGDVAAVREPLALVRSHHEHYTRDRTGVYESRLRLLEKHEANAASLDASGVLRAERARTRIALAVSHASRGCRRSAIAALWRGRKCLVQTPRFWVPVLKAAVGALAPKRLRRMRAARPASSRPSLAPGRG